MRLAQSAASEVSILQSDTLVKRGRDAVSDDGVAFIGGGDRIPAAGLAAQMQLWNPPGSGVDVYVDRWEFSTAGALMSKLFRQTTELTGVVHLGRNASSAGSGAQAYVNANDSNVSTGTSLFILNIGTDRPTTIDFPYPLILTPGWGISMAGLVNTRVGLAVYWREY